MFPASAASRWLTVRTPWMARLPRFTARPRLTHFEVWAYQVNPREVSVGDPIDLSKRLDGNRTVRFS